MLLLLTTNGASERLGHMSVVITLDTYSHVLPTMQQDAMSRLAGFERPPESSG
jgi:hypothetical protein